MDCCKETERDFEHVIFPYLIYSIIKSIDSQHSMYYQSLLHRMSKKKKNSETDVCVWSFGEPHFYRPILIRIEAAASGNRKIIFLFVFSCVMWADNRHSWSRSRTTHKSCCLFMFFSLLLFIYFVKSSKLRGYEGYARRDVGAWALEHGFIPALKIIIDFFF